MPNQPQQNDWQRVDSQLQYRHSPRSGIVTQSPKRAELPENSHRGGVLGMAAVLAVSSYPQRTSPVLRGKWILDALLGTPPPAPPPNVPELKEEHAGDAPQTLRERLLQHRQSPADQPLESGQQGLGRTLHQDRRFPHLHHGH